MLSKVFRSTCEISPIFSELAQYQLLLRYTILVVLRELWRTATPVYLRWLDADVRKNDSNELDMMVRVRVQIALDTTVGSKRLKNARRNGSEVNLTGPRRNNVAKVSLAYWRMSF